MNNTFHTNSFLDIDLSNDLSNNLSYMFPSPKKYNNEPYLVINPTSILKNITPKYFTFESNKLHTNLDKTITKYSCN